MQRLSLDALQPVTGGTAVTVVVDDSGISQQLEAAGIPALQLRTDLKLPTEHVLLVLCHAWVTRELRALFADAATLVVPAMCFDSAPDAVSYTLTLLLSSDFEATCRRNNEWIELLRWQKDGLLHFTGPGTDLRCHLGDNLSVHTCVDVALQRGEWVSIADYFEVSLTPPSTKDWAGSFSLDGHARATGVLVAEDSRVDSEGQARVERAKKLRDAFVHTSPIDLELSGGVLTNLQVGGIDRLAEVLDATNPDHGLHAVELGLGSNLDVGALVDWRFNSQMNEGAAPVHLGFGEGITGAHMDFVLEGTALANNS